MKGVEVVSPPRPRQVCAIESRVVTNEVICREHVAIELSVREFPPSEPGQFLELLCGPPAGRCATRLEWPSRGFPRPAGHEWDEREAYLRRPFSIGDRTSGTDGSARLLVISRAIGAGTRWLEKLRPGDSLDLTGPLGRPFRIPNQRRPLVLVGGGVGIPPLLYLARRLRELDRTDVVVIFGATSAELFPVQRIGEPARDGSAGVCLELPGGAEFPAIVTTDDGTLGLGGRVTDGLRAWHDRGRRADGVPLVFACGPEGMLRAVARMTRDLSMDCQLCIERNMGCGLGTCLSCVVRVCAPHRPSGWRWSLSCSEGPVYDRDVLYEEPNPCTP
jgi:NAD(P)H-flavin reductase